MSAQLPHERTESGPSNSGSSSVESLRRGTPNTPPQIQLNLDPVAISDATVFSNFFPWMKQSEAQSESSITYNNQATPNDTAAIEKPAPHIDAIDADPIAAFQQRQAAHLPRQSLLLPSVPEVAAAPTLDLFQPFPPTNTIESTSARANVQSGSALLGFARNENTMGRVSMSSANFYTAAEHGSTQSCFESERDIRSSVGHQQPESSSSHHMEATHNPSRLSHSPLPVPANAIRLASPPPSQSPQSRLAAAAVWTGSSSPTASNSDAVHVTPLKTSTHADVVVLDVFEDDRLPGYQVWKRGTTSSTAMVVRIPRQVMGWKAVLMDACDFGDAAYGSTEQSKKARRTSKVVGKQGWEVRQEALKNSYDFRRGSGIWATMHAGHRLFKHDWHVIAKDGSRYVWRMDKTALALFREEDDVKVAEFRKAVPSSSPTVQLGNGQGYTPDMDKRIGSFTKFAGWSSPTSSPSNHSGAVFDTSLAVASLMAVFKARGGHQNVSAAFEPSSDPLRNVLERQRQETPDREEVMLALPRPGFARDAESVLSDTTDEDAGSDTNDTAPRRSAPTSSGFVDRRPPGMKTPSNDVASTAPHRNGGRKRFSSLFGRGNASADVQAEDGLQARDRPMTDSQRIARQYRTQSMFLGR